MAENSAKASKSSVNSAACCDKLMSKEDTTSQASTFPFDVTGSGSDSKFSGMFLSANQKQSWVNSCSQSFELTFFSSGVNATSWHLSFAFGLVKSGVVAVSEEPLSLPFLAEHCSSCVGTAEHCWGSCTLDTQTVGCAVWLATLLS